MGKKSADYSSEAGSYDDYGYGDGATGEVNSVCGSNAWGNDCCPSWHRILLLVFGVIFFAAALYQGSHVGDFVQRVMDDKIRSLDSAASNNKYSNKMNPVSDELLAVAEFAAVFTVGAGIAVVWHVLKWNVASRFAVVVVVGAATALNLTTLAFYAKQMKKDKPLTGAGDIDPAIMGAGSIGLVNSVFGLFLMYFVHYFASGYMSAAGQTNCCDNMGCSGENDVGCDCCGCSLGRWLVFIFGAMGMAFAVVKAAQYGSLVDELLNPNGNSIVLNNKGNFLLSNYSYALILDLALPALVLLHAWAWNVTTQTSVLVVGFAGIANQAWAFAYATVFLDEGKVESGTTEKDNDERIMTIASLAVVSLIFSIVAWFMTWFFSDEYRKYDTEEDDYDEEPECCETMCSWAGLTIAKGIIGVLVLLALIFYVVRGAVAGKIQQNWYDSQFGAATRYKSNSASPLLLDSTMVGAPMGVFVALIGVFHLFFWNRVTATMTTVGFIVLFFSDAATTGYGFKQTQLYNKHKDTVAQPQAKPSAEYLTLESFATLSLVVGLAIAVCSFVFTCGFNKADYGRERAGYVPSYSDEEDEYTYATADSYSA